MRNGKSFSSRALRDVSGIMDYEILFSRPGISEPDSNFIWASTFTVPVGVGFIRENVYFNIFLPEGSENEGDKKLFLNRVGAKLQDDLWQVRRSMDEIHGTYGPAIKMAVKAFNSIMLDYSYIKKGRTYAHFVFNKADLPAISRALLAFPSNERGLRVEYLKKATGEVTIFKHIDENGEAATISIEAFKKEDSPEQAKHEDEFFFVMGNVLGNGVKSVGKADGKRVPDILSPVNITELGEGITTFDSENPLIVDLLERMASEYIVVYGFYGAAYDKNVRLSINVPIQQAPAIIRILGQLSENSGPWEVRLTEVINFREILDDS